MRFKRNLFPIFISFFLFFSTGPHLRSVYAFTYYDDCLFTEVKSVAFNITLTEGFHILVIENTGYCAGECYTDRKTANTQYLAILPKSTSPLAERSINGEAKLESQDYLVVNITLTVMYGNSALTSFLITSTSKVSVFLTNEEGLNEFIEEIDNTEFTQRPLSIPFIVVAVGIVFTAGIVGIVIIYRQQKQAYSIYTIGEKKAKHFVSSHKAPSTPGFQKINTLTDGSKNHLPLKRLCPECGSTLLSTQEFCSICGKRTEYEKR